MAVNEEDINALTSELQKFRENFGGMLDDTRKSRVTLEVLKRPLRNNLRLRPKLVTKKMTLSHMKVMTLMI